MKKIDPKHKDFDPYACWEKANCDYVEEYQYGDLMDDNYDECLYCSAPYDFICPLYEIKIKEDLENDII